MHAKGDPQPGRNIVRALVRTRESAIFLALVLLMTLGMLSFASGLVLGLTKGWPITDVPASFLPIAQGSFLGLPIPVWIAVAIAVLAHVALSTTAFGRRTYAIGGNEQATFLSGIDVKRIKFFLYLIPAACASIAGIILVARFNSAQADTGKGWELDAIAAAVIGGASPPGGPGGGGGRAPRGPPPGGVSQR